MAQLNWNHGARSIIEMDGDGCFEFVVSPDAQGIACGLNNSDGGADPREITHGVMVLARELCVVERGVMVAPWQPAPFHYAAMAWKIRIYRIGGHVVYTAGAHDVGDPQFYEDTAARATVRGVEVRGAILHQSQVFSSGPVFLDASFGAAANIILDAQLLDVQSMGGYVQARLPAWRGKSVDADRTEVRLPAWRATASDLEPDHVLARLPQWKARAGISAFDIQRNEVYAKLPGWRTEDPALKVRPIQVPGWRAKAQGPNQTLARVPRTRAHGGDAINLVYARLPGWRGSSMAPRDMAGLAYGQVVLPVMLVPFAPPADVLPTDALRGVLGGSMEPFIEAELTTDPMVGLLSGQMVPFGEIMLETGRMEGRLGGEVTAYASVTLETATLAGLLGGSIDAQAEAVLPVQPMVGLLGGSITVLSGLSEVFALNMTGGKPGGTTRYDGYDFNSYARIGDRFFGASEQGLFVLDGPDDAGRPIAASFGLGQLDFGSPQLKTVSHCYLGAAAGAMTLRVDALQRGQPASYSYAARGHGASMRELRFDLGKGLSSSYITPTFANACGQAFAVDAVRFLINESARRI